MLLLNIKITYLNNLFSRYEIPKIYSNELEISMHRNVLWKFMPEEIMHKVWLKNSIQLIFLLLLNSNGKHFAIKFISFWRCFLFMQKYSKASHEKIACNQNEEKWKTRSLAMIEKFKIQRLCAWLKDISEEKDFAIAGIFRFSFSVSRNASRPKVCIIAGNVDDGLYFTKRLTV